MLNRFAILAVICLSIPIATAPLTAADPNADPPLIPVADSAPPPPEGAVLSGDPDIVTTPDGWTLTVSARNETQVNVPPLTTALSSREYLVGGTFTGSIKGSGSGALTGGTLQAGYQIGCGINAGNTKPFFGIGLTPTVRATGAISIAVPITGRVEVELVPGTVILIPVDKKTVTGRDVGIKITGVHIKVDSCVGQSFLRSYATLTSSTADTDAVISYYGVTKVV